MLVRDTGIELVAHRQLHAFIQQRIRHVYRRQRPTSLPSRTAKSRHQSQLGIDDLDVPHARSVGRRSFARTSPFRREHTAAFGVNATGLR
jgi:hypothetical protein